MEKATNKCNDERAVGRAYFKSNVMSREMKTGNTSTVNIAILSDGNGERVRERV